MEKTIDMLTRELNEEIQNLSVMENGSDSKSKAIDDVAKLHRLKMEEIKASHDLQTKKEEIAEAKKTRIWRVVCEVGATAVSVLGLALASYWTRKGYEFEETGVVCSDTLKENKRTFSFRRR